MNREDFSTFVAVALEEAVLCAEQKAGQSLPRTLSFRWNDRSERVTENIVEHIVDRVFIDEKHIYPDVDLGVCDLLDDGTLLVVGMVANHPPPRPFGQNAWKGEGPFEPIVGIAFLNKLAGVKDTFSLDKPFHFISRRMAKDKKPWLVRPDIPKLPDKLRDDLSAILPSQCGDLAYWPCAARMKDGTVLVCVYVVLEGPYIRRWGVYPQQDRRKSYISVVDVDALAESPSRLPARLANKLYEAGESGMGYTIFTVVFADGSRQAYGTGNAIDFVAYPEGKGQGDVLDVLPHEGRNAEPASCPEYYWCLFSE
jgi:hypothetical protein